MIYQLIAQLVSLLLDLFASRRRSARHKDLPIRLLRQQLRIRPRQQPQALHVSRWEKFTLAGLTNKLTHFSRDAKAKLDQTMLLFQLATVLKGHRDLVRRKGTFQQPPWIPHHQSAPARVKVLLRLAQENPRWGYRRLPGERLKLGDKMGRSTVRDIRKRQHIPPAPQRTDQRGNWRTLLGPYAHHRIACDFFTVETAWLQTL